MPAITDKLQLVGSGFASHGLRVLTTLVMARLVAPEEYGLYALVLSVPAIINAIGDFGIPATLVQIKGHAERAIIETGLALIVSIYCVYGLVTLAGGLYLWQRYDDGRLLGIAGLVAASGLLAAVYNVQLSVLNRRMARSAEAKQNMIFATASAVTGIVLAALGAGVFALATQVLAGQLLANLAILRHTPLRIPTHASRQLAIDYLKIGGRVTMAGYCANVQTNVTNLVVNQMAGQAALGAWGRSCQVTQLFGQNLLASFQRVAYPMLCAAADDERRLRELFTRTLLVLMLPSAFACAWLIVGREQIVRLVLGPQWGMVPPLLAIAALAVPAGVLYSTGYTTAYALGKTGRMLKVGVLDLLLFLPMLAGAYWLGLLAVAGAWVASRYLAAVLLLAASWRQLRPPTAPIARSLAAMTLAAAAAGLVMAQADRLLIDQLLIVRLTLSSTVALACYVGLMTLLQRELVIEIVRLSLRRKPAPVPAAKATSTNADATSDLEPDAEAPTTPRPPVAAAAAESEGR